MSLLLSTLRLIFFLLRQYFFLKRHFLKTWHLLYKENQPFFTKKRYNRLFYYALQLPVMLGDSLTLLRDKKLSQDERMRLTLLCAFTPLLDDWFDEERIAAAEISWRIYNPEQFEAVSIGDRLAKSLLLNLHEVTPSGLNWQSVAEKLLEAQDMRRQLTDQAEASTRMMGGFSVLLARLMLDPVPSGDERAAILSLGYGVQLLDDIFDVYDDSREGLRTMPVVCESVLSLEQQYFDCLKDISRKFYALSYNKNQIRRFLTFWWSFFARAMVSLEQLHEVEKKHGAPFRPQDYERRELICDMETASAIRRYIIYYFRYRKRIFG